jgi:hypothetical protein
MIICPLRQRSRPLTRRPMPSKRKMLSRVQARYIRKVAQALEYLVLLLDPPLVIEADAIKEATIQDDHLVVVEEEDAKAFVK